MNGMPIIDNVHPHCYSSWAEAGWSSYAIQIVCASIAREIDPVFFTVYRAQGITRDGSKLVRRALRKSSHRYRFQADASVAWHSNWCQ
jgi:hypothetical protein